MASLIGTELIGVVGDVLAEHGETITYTPGSGAPTSPKAIVLRSTRHSIFNKGNAVEDYDEMEIRISARSDAEGRLTPKEYVRNATGDQCTIDGETWYVREIVDRAVNGWHRLLLTNKLFPAGNWGNG